MTLLNIHSLVYIQFILGRAKINTIKEMYGYGLECANIQSPDVVIKEVGDIHDYHEVSRIGKNAFFDANSRVFFLLDRKGKKLALHITDRNSITSVAVESGFDDGYFINILDFIIYLHLIRTGLSFLHCAGVSYGSKNILFPAWAGTDKTEVLIEFINKGAKFIADDWVIVNGKGEFLGYSRSPILYEEELGLHKQYLDVRSFRHRVYLRIYFSAPFRKVISKSNYLRNAARAFLHISKVTPTVVYPISKFAVHGVRSKGKIDVVYLLIKGSFNKISINPLSCEEFIKRMDACHRYELCHKFNYHMLDFAFPNEGIGGHILRNSKNIWRECFQRSEIKLVLWPDSIGAKELSETLIKDTSSKRA